MITVTAPSSARLGTQRGAHRNILIATINAFLAHGLIGPAVGQNYWPGAPAADSYLFEFELPGGIPAAAYVHDPGGELAFHVALWPHTDWRSRLKSSFAGADAGEAFVCGWLERKLGFWLQDCFCDGYIKQVHLPQLAALDIQPDGYGIGPFLR